MAIRFACECGKRLRAPDTMAGRRTQCPSCWTMVAIPSRWSLTNFLHGAADPRPSRSGCAAERHAAASPQDKKSISNAVGLRTRGRVQTASTSPKTAVSHSMTGNGIVAHHTAPGRATPQRHPASTFVPARANTNEWDPSAALIALRNPPRWLRLISRRVEHRWHQSLLYPLANVPVFFKLAFMLTVLTAFALGGWLSIDAERPSGPATGVLCFSLLFLAFVLGRTLNYFNAILRLAAEGKIKRDPGVGFDPLHALLGCARWLGCLIAGPFFLFAAALGYWTYSGDLSLVDWSIVAELGVAGIAWWLIAILLINVNPSIRIPTPAQVVRMAFRLGPKSAELTLLATAVFLAHFFAAVYGIGHLHDKPVIAFGLLCLSATTGLYLTAFTFRRLGLAYYRAMRRHHVVEIA